MGEHAKSADLKPGTRLRWRDTNDVVTLSHRKAESDRPDTSLPFHPGWWLADDRGGLADFVIDAEDSDWHIVTRTTGEG